MNKQITQITAVLLFVASSFMSYAQTPPIPWNLGGNSSPTNNKIGTITTDLFQFITNNQDRLILKADGRLGLNTTTPTAMFEIDYCLPASPNNGGFLVTKTLCPSGYTVFAFDPNIQREVIGIPFDPNNPPVETAQIKTPFSYLTGHTTNPITPLANNEGPLIWARTKGANGWMLGNSNDFNTKFIVMPDGSCGINIAQPRAALDVRGSQGFNRPAAIIGSLALGTYNLNPTTNLPQYYTQQVQFIPNLTADGFNRISQLNDQGMFFSDGKGTDGTDPNGSNLNGAFVLAPWAQEGDEANVGGMRMDKFGNTEFHGTVRATKVNVDAKWWSDFVFDEDYNLMSLAEVEAYITANKHLPNVPSEAEVLQNGLDVANMQAIQQQKIEELTLYTIDQEKRIAAQ